VQPLPGDYRVIPIPYPGVSDDETFSIEVTLEGNTTLLVENERVGDIPAEGYVSGCSLDCPSVVVVPNDPGECGAHVEYADPGVTGTCGTLTCSAASGEFFPVGTTQVTCTSEAATSCAFDVTVRDEESPVADIVFPANGSCQAGPVTVRDESSDNCPATLTRSYDPPPGPTYSSHGHHVVRQTVLDGAQQSSSDTVEFTIDTVPPAVRIVSPPSDQLALPPVSIPINVAFTSADEDGARGGISREVLKLQGCTIFDGQTWGDRDGLLSDESLLITKQRLCQWMSECGFTILYYPKIRAEAVDTCGGNVGAAERIIRKRLLKTEVCTRP
jgi:hypothetical protein